MSLRDDILALEDRPLIPVPVPEWKTIVYVRALSLAELAAMGAAQDGQDKAMSNAATVARVALDAQGRRLFVDDDAATLAGKSATALLRIVQASSKANLIDVDAAKGNSDGTA